MAEVVSVMQFPSQTSDYFTQTYTYTQCVASRNHISCLLYAGDLALKCGHNKKLNKPSVSKPLLSFPPRCDKSPSLQCMLSSSSVCKGEDLFQHPATHLHVWAYVSNLHCSNFRIYSLFLNLAQKKLKYTQTHSLTVFNWSPW